MTDSEEWKVQASFKFGPNLQGLLNIRANNPDELAGLCLAVAERLGAEDYLTELGSVLAPVSATQAVANVQAGFPQAQQVVGPTCAHGAMKDLSHKGYRKRWYCPAPKGQPQCPAQD